jgi:hypothetical protein
VACASEHCNEPSGCIKGGVFLTSGGVSGGLNFILNVCLWKGNVVPVISQRRTKNTICSTRRISKCNDKICVTQGLTSLIFCLNL